MNTTAHILQTLIKELDDAELTQLDAIMHAEIGQASRSSRSPSQGLRDSRRGTLRVAVSDDSALDVTLNPKDPKGHIGDSDLQLCCRSDSEDFRQGGSDGAPAR